MAQLHRHAAEWNPPPGFTRRQWDWEGLFGDNSSFYLATKKVWALVPHPYRDPFVAVVSQARQVMDALGEADNVFGLIHADLLVGDDGNILLCDGEVRPIDFDDCGSGYWLYDLAAPLASLQKIAGWPALRDALLEGYAQVHPLPQGLLAHLDLFIAVRHVWGILWGTDQAQVNPCYREGLDEWLERVAAHVRRYLDGR